MLRHLAECLCALCKSVSTKSVPIAPVDREHLADEWETWISTTDGEAAKLRAGENGAPGSPRWTALQAIARTRLLYGPPWENANG